MTTGSLPKGGRLQLAEIPTPIDTTVPGTSKPTCTPARTSPTKFHTEIDGLTRNSRTGRPSTSSSRYRLPSDVKTLARLTLRYAEPEESEPHQANIATMEIRERTSLVIEPGTPPPPDRTEKTERPPSSSGILMRLALGHEEARAHQLVAQQELLTYSNKSGAALAILVEGLGLGSNTAPTFGVGVTGGTQASSDAATNVLPSIRSGKAATLVEAPFGERLAASTAGLGGGAIAGGAGSVLGQTLVAPLIVGLAAAITGGTRSFQKTDLDAIFVKPSKLNGDGTLKDLDLYRAQQDTVAGQRALAEKAQNEFGIDSLKALVFGTGSFDALHGGRAALDASGPLGQLLSLGRRIGEGTFASGIAGVMTGFLIGLAKARATVPVEIDGQIEHLPLFQVSTPGPTAPLAMEWGAIKAAGAERGAMISNSVKGAMKDFAAGHTGVALASHTTVQTALRSAGILIATTANAILTAAVPSLPDPNRRASRMGVSSIATALAYTAAVLLWFTLLPKIKQVRLAALGSS